MSDLAPGLDISIFEGVLAVGDASDRLAMAVQLANLVNDPATPGVEVEQVSGVLLKLSLDPEKKVRAALAAALCRQTRIDVAVAFAIVADDDDIALPFLTETPVLRSAELKTILKVGDDSRQRVIAGRADIPSDVCRFIIKSGAVAAVMALFENPAVAIDAADCRTLYQRLGQSADVVERLLALANLPLDIRIAQARRAATRMRQMMAEKAWLPANDASQLCTEAEDNAVMQVLVEASARERADAVAYMASKNMLTPALIIRAAATGRTDVVEAALAHLAGVSQQRSAEMMYASSGMGLRSLFRKSGLPPACQGLLRAACDVMIDVREEGIGISSGEFGGRLLEALMTRYVAMPAQERSKAIELLGRYGEVKIRKVAKRLRADLVRAA